MFVAKSTFASFPANFVLAYFQPCAFVFFSSLDSPRLGHKTYQEHLSKNLQLPFIKFAHFFNTKIILRQPPKIIHTHIWGAFWDRGRGCPTASLRVVGCPRTPVPEPPYICVCPSLCLIPAKQPCFTHKQSLFYLLLPRGRVLIQEGRGASV